MPRTKKTTTEETTEAKVDFTTAKRVKIWFFTELLGSLPKDPEIYVKYIASKALDAPSVQDELSMLPQDEVIEKGTTVFLVRTRGKDKGKVCLASYCWLGFFKEKTKFLRQETGSGFDKFSNYKSKIDGNFAIDKPFITLELPEGTELGTCQRPLRAETAQGPRVAIAASQSCPPGTTMEYELNIFNKDFNKYAYACLEKGYWNGMCQWRSGGKGRFVFEVWDGDKIVAGNTKERVGCDSTSPKWNEYFEDFLDEYRL